MFKSKLSKIALAVSSVLIISGIAYFNLKKEEKINYITIHSSIGNIEDTVLANGIIHPLQKVEVGSQATGQIQKIHVKLNQEVKAGDLLVEIRSDTQKDNLRDAEYNLANYKAQLESKEVNLEKADLRYKRQLSMLKADATSQEEVDDARINFEQAKADITEIKTKIKQAENSLNTSKTNLSYTNIRSPIDGIVVSIPVSIGQTINATQASPTVAQIAQVDTVLIKPEIAEADIIKVKSGMPLYFNILGDTDRIYKSTLKSIDIGPTTLSDQGKSSTTTTTGTNTGIYYYGEFEYPNEDKSFRMSMSAQVSIIIGQAKDVVQVPSEVIKTNKKGDKYVVVLNNGKKEERIIETGLTNNIYTEVKSGLKENEEIILTEGKADMPSLRGGPRIR
jgi:membrane fusion protein, macrolide-specific efflux system